MCEVVCKVSKCLFYPRSCAISPDVHCALCKAFKVVCKVIKVVCKVFKAFKVVFKVSSMVVHQVQKAGHGVES